MNIINNEHDCVVSELNGPNSHI